MVSDGLCLPSCSWGPISVLCRVFCTAKFNLRLLFCLQFGSISLSCVVPWPWPCRGRLCLCIGLGWVEDASAWLAFRIGLGWVEDAAACKFGVCLCLIFFALRVCLRLGLDDLDQAQSKTRQEQEQEQKGQRLGWVGLKTKMCLVLACVAISALDWNGIRLACFVVSHVALSFVWPRCVLS